MLHIDIPTGLKLARQASGLSQREAAETMGFTRRAFNRWENGAAEPQPVHAHLLSLWIQKTLSKHRVKA
jgi:DNA-binding transcriptional regulator YiaG